MYVLQNWFALVKYLNNKDRTIFASPFNLDSLSGCLSTEKSNLVCFYMVLCTYLRGLTAGFGGKNSVLQEEIS